MEDNQGNKIPFEETNMFNFGTELEIKVKKALAENEPEWHKLSDESGIKVWRIESFNVKSWPENLYGSFYDGDSYIVLITNKNTAGIVFREAHMWVGRKTTADESGTAAYKIVELDDYFDRKVTLVWNSQGNETEHFLNAFDGKIKIMHGGINSGFKHVEKEIKPVELFEIFNSRVIQVKPNADSLTSKNSFVLDTQDVIYLWRGKNSRNMENFNAAMLVNDLKVDRGKIITKDINQGEEDEEFWIFLGGKKEVKDTHNKYSGKRNSQSLLHEKKMNRISDCSGELKIKEIEFGKENLNSDDVFLIQTYENIVLWIGKDSSRNEKIHCMGHTRKYVKENKLTGVKIFLVNEGNEPTYFESMF